jgi:hypothetical protein
MAHFSYQKIAHMIFGNEKCFKNFLFTFLQSKKKAFCKHLSGERTLRKNPKLIVLKNIWSAMTTLPSVLHYMCILCMLRLQAAQTGPGVGRKSRGIERFSMYVLTYMIPIVFEFLTCIVYNKYVYNKSILNLHNPVIKSGK